jgi:hypothetical protein
MISVRYDFAGDDGRARADLHIDMPGLPGKRIFFELLGEAAPKERPGAEFAVLAALPMAMRLSQPLHVAGAAEGAFLASVEELQQAWARWRPDLFRPVPVSVEEETAARATAGRRAIAAFSGGLDSVFALHAHKRRLLGRRSLDIEAAFLVQGFDLPLDAADRFDRARRAAAAMLDHYGVPLTVVRTDWGRISSPWGQTFMMGLAAVLHLFSRDFDCGVVAADLPYDGEVLGWGSNSITNPMLGSRSFPVHSTGAGWSRAEKAGVVGEEAPVLAHLRACTKSAEGGNCGRCEKCVRTKLDFLVNGVESVPALGSPVAAEDLAGMRINGPQAYFWREILARGDWSGRRDLEKAIAALLACGEGLRPAPQPLRRRRSGLRLWLKYFGA